MMSTVAGQSGDQGDSVTQVIVERVAAERGVEPLELPPLYQAIDPEALEALITSSSEGQELRLTFSYGGHRVSVTESGSVEVGDHSKSDAGRREQ